jgi:hypothetical protein
MPTTAQREEAFENYWNAAYANELLWMQLAGLHEMLEPDSRYRPPRRAVLAKMIEVIKQVRLLEDPEYQALMERRRQRELRELEV